MELIELTKICTKCEIRRNWKKFDEQKKGRFGINSQCKICLKNYRYLNRKNINIRSKAHYEANKERKLLLCKINKKVNKEKIKEQKKEYYLKNKERILKRCNEYVKNNIEKVKACGKIYRDKNKEKISEYSKIYAKNNRKKVKTRADNYYKTHKKERAEYRKSNQKRQNTWAKDKRKKDPKFKLRCYMSRSIACALKNNNKGGKSWLELVPYTLNQLKKHLEKQFIKGMSWENYGPVWHLDHKIPLSVFNFTKPEHDDFQRCWALKNLQPLLAEDNLKKNAKLEKPFQPSLLL